MFKSVRPFWLPLAILLAVAWQLLSNTLTPTASSGACQVVQAGAGAIAYGRPSLASDPFAPLDVVQLPLWLSARTADGWLGFEPGVAQAANVGIFRLRWVLATEVTVKGNCEALPEVVGPPPGVCFTMPMEDTAVYAQPNSNAPIVATLTVGQYAAVKDIGGGWAYLEQGVGNGGLERGGWIPQAALNLNGPCQDPFAE